MMKRSTLFLAAAILSVLVALIWHSHAITNGLGKAMFGVFFILYLIGRLFAFEEENAS